MKQIVELSDLLEQTVFFGLIMKHCSYQIVFVMSRDELKNTLFIKTPFIMSKMDFITTYYHQEKT